MPSYGTFDCFDAVLSVVYKKTKRFVDLQQTNIIVFGVITQRQEARSAVDRSNDRRKDVPQTIVKDVVLDRRKPRLVQPPLTTFVVFRNFTEDGWDTSKVAHRNVVFHGSLYPAYNWKHLCLSFSHPVSLLFVKLGEQTYLVFHAS